MRYQLLASMICFAIAEPACDRAVGGFPAAPSPALPVVPAPSPPAYPSITIGEVIRFEFTLDDVRCTNAEGRCRSYNVTAPSGGTLEAELTSVSGEDTFISTTEMYVVPGGDWWTVGPGPRISVAVPATAGGTYEIRMYSARLPSVELELRTWLH